LDLKIRGDIKVKKKIIFSVALILIGILIICINKIIGNFDWHLRCEFIWIASFMIPLGIFLLGIFILKIIKNKGAKIFLNIFWSLIILAVVFVEFMLLCWFIKTTNIKEIDGVKYCGVEYLTNRLRKNVYYYKEYNIFAYHETKEYIEEFYEHNDYIHPLYREYHTEDLKDSVIYYYDKSRNITKIIRYDENGNKIEVQQ
jgi:hypothetical protein